MTFFLVVKYELRKTAKEVRYTSHAFSEAKPPFQESTSARTEEAIFGLDDVILLFMPRYTVVAVLGLGKKSKYESRNELELNLVKIAVLIF